MGSRRASGSEIYTRMSASELVADTLQREILRGDILPGQPLLQDHIAARFDVSQSSVREALRRLEGLSLVVSVRNRGTFVSGLTIEQVEELYEVRLALELVALKHNFSRISGERLAEAESLLDSIDRNEEIGFLGVAHRNFHAVFYESEDRTFAKDMLENVYANLTRVWADVVKKRPRFAHAYELQSRRDHRDLVQAARDHDFSAAESVLTRHVTNAKRTMVEHLRVYGMTGSGQLPAKTVTGRRNGRRAAAEVAGNGDEPGG